MSPSLPSDVMLAALLEALERAEIGCSIYTERDGTVERLYANRVVGKLLGVEHDDVMNRSPLDALNPEQRTAFLADLHAAREGRNPSTRLTADIARPDGSHVPLAVSLGFASVGEEKAMVSFVQDATARVEAERALRNSEERFRALADASPDSITLYAEGRYLYANKIARGYLGISSDEELASFDPSTLVPPRRRKELSALVERVASGERVPPVVTTFRDRSGVERTVEASLARAEIDGKVCLLSCARDITTRVRLQAELVKQERLASVGMLAAGVAHELNNPLAAMMLLLGGLIGDTTALSDEQRAALAEVKQAAERMRAIVSDLLFMARPVEKPQAHVDVAKIVKSTAKLLAAGRRDCPDVEMRAFDLPPIQGYASKLGQVFFNVLRNAVEVVEGLDAPAVRVSGSATEHGVEISIEDNGPGIPDELVDTVMQPFFTTKSQGTGLGLWISQNIVSLHGGTLTIGRSEMGGAEIRIALPFAIPEHGR